MGMMNNSVHYLLCGQPGVIHLEQPGISDGYPYHLLVEKSTISEKKQSFLCSFSTSPALIS